MTAAVPGILRRDDRPPIEMDAAPAPGTVAASRPTVLPRPWVRAGSRPPAPRAPPPPPRWGLLLPFTAPSRGARRRGAGASGTGPGTRLRDGSPPRRGTYRPAAPLPASRVPGPHLPHLTPT